MSYDNNNNNQSDPGDGVVDGFNAAMLGATLGMALGKSSREDPVMYKQPKLIEGDGLPSKCSKRTAHIIALSTAVACMGIGGYLNPLVFIFGAFPGGFISYILAREFIDETKKPLIPSPLSWGRAKKPTVQRAQNNAPRSKPKSGLKKAAYVAGVLGVLALPITVAIAGSIVGYVGYVAYLAVRGDERYLNRQENLGQNKTTAQHGVLFSSGGNVQTQKNSVVKAPEKGLQYASEKPFLLTNDKGEQFAISSGEVVKPCGRDARGSYYFSREIDGKTIYGRVDDQALQHMKVCASPAQPKRSEGTVKADRATYG